VKVISGGQTGVDQAGLIVARAFGLATGGVAPYGWRTDDGPAPWLESYGLVQSADNRYPARTLRNVCAAHVTVWYGVKSPGYKLTKKYCDTRGRPFLENLPMGELLYWLARVSDGSLLKGFIMNVAGNRFSTHPESARRASYELSMLFEGIANGAVIL